VEVQLQSFSTPAPDEVLSPFAHLDSCTIKSHVDPLTRKLGGPVSPCRLVKGEKNLLPVPGIELQFLCRPACSIVTIPTEPSWLSLLSLRVYFYKIRT
jgi:hypothetical protein